MNTKKKFLKRKLQHDALYFGVSMLFQDVEWKVSYEETIKKISDIGKGLYNEAINNDSSRKITSSSLSTEETLKFKSSIKSITDKNLSPKFSQKVKESRHTMASKCNNRTGKKR